MTRLERIAERVNRNGDVNDPTTPRPLLKLAEFIDGNEVVGSIACHLVPTPTPVEFYEVLKSIAQRPEVADVRVRVTMFDDPEWPFSDVVWVITAATPDEVAQSFEEAVRPDNCWAGWPDNVAMEPCQVPAGMQPIGCFWD